jgi:hypothetical protein
MLITCLQGSIECMISAVKASQMRIIGLISTHLFIQPKVFPSTLCHSNPGSQSHKALSSLSP